MERPEPQDTRLKAATSVALKDASGATVTRAKVGDTLTLVVGAAVERARQDGAPPTSAALPDGAFEPRARVQLTVSP